MVMKNEKREYHPFGKYRKQYADFQSEQTRESTDDRQAAGNYSVEHYQKYCYYHVVLFNRNNNYNGRTSKAWNFGSILFNYILHLFFI